MNANSLITSISVVIAAFSFVSGVSAWKREFTGKRQIELAESVLAMFYEVEDVIREIRNPFSSTIEGKSRQRSEYEIEEESQLLDRAFIVFERYQKREKLFAELRSIKYRFMAVFGSQAGEPFKEMENVLQEIFISARILGKHYWQRQGRVSMSEDEFQRHLEEMNKHEAVFWYMGENKDAISPRMRNVVQQVENITSAAVKSNLDAAGWLSSLFVK
jgi:hypothetical protein